MNTVFLLMAQFNSATLTIEQVCECTNLKPSVVREKIACGKFPATIRDFRVWRLQDVAAWIDAEIASARGRVLNRESEVFDDLRHTVETAIRKAVKVSQPVVYLLLQGLVVVYVGMSKAHLGRLQQHYSGKHRKPFDRVSMIRCATIDEAAKLERQLIAYLSPRFNKIGMPA